MRIKNKHLQIAIFLSILTVSYNFIEGVISIYFGFADDTLALFGFGVDSFVEVISGIGIWHMVLRIQSNENQQRDEFEVNALKITGFSFYLLAIGLFISSIINLINFSKPDTTFWGIVISTLSLFVMWYLMYNKKKIGNILESDAILADANCTRTCIQLSFVLLIASIGYELFQINYIDAVGAIFISGIAFKEGREAIEKSKMKTTCC